MDTQVEPVVPVTDLSEAQVRYLDMMARKGKEPSDAALRLLADIEVKPKRPVR